MILSLLLTVSCAAPKIHGTHAARLSKADVQQIEILALQIIRHPSRVTDISVQRTDEVEVTVGRCEDGSCGKFTARRRQDHWTAFGRVHVIVTAD